MKNIHNPVSRRVFLRKAGAVLPLPFLASLHDRLWGSAGLKELSSAPKRFLAVHFTYGMLPQNWWPEQGVEGWQRTPSLEPLAPHRDDLTLLRGVSLRRGSSVGGHGEPFQFLNADRLSKVSLDQILAADESFGRQTRYSSIETGGEPLGEALAYTPEGIPLPAICDATRLYDRLFGDDGQNPQVVIERLRQRKSVLDALIEEIGDVNRHLDRVDREKLDEYLSSVRQIERNIERTEAWINTPKPNVSIARPESTPTVDQIHALAETFLDLLVAAFETDQTRVASFYFKNTSLFTTAGRVSDYHSFTHHNGNELQQAELAQADRLRNEAMGRLLTKLKEKRDADGSRMLDNTLVLYGSAAEDTNLHQGTSLPLMLAGRPDLLKHGRRHGGMVEYAFNRVGMSNLLLTLLQAQGIDLGLFGDAESTMSELLV